MDKFKIDSVRIKQSKRKTQYTTADFVSYRITGKLYNSRKRFCKTTVNGSHAMGINLWNGSVWGVKADGKKVLLKRVTN